MQVREATSDEYDAIAELTVSAYQRLFDEPLGPYELELRDVGGRAADSEILAAVDGGTVLGSVTYVAGAGQAMSEFDDPEASGIRMLAVDPAHQGRGAGRALVEACIAHARTDGRRRVVLHSTREMTVAHALYTSLGFVRDERHDLRFTDPPYSEDEPFVLLAFELEL